jgi:hypothetical protein
MNTNGDGLQDRAVLSGQAVIQRKPRMAAISAMPGNAGVNAGCADVGCLPDIGEDLPCVVMSSSCGDHEGHVVQKACPSSSGCRECAELLHELSNVMTSVLTNAQVLGWKLPPYSHLKRPVREMERGAQRSGELLRRLMQRCTEEA